MQLHAIASIGYDATAVVHVSVIMLQPPQPHVHFCQFINYYWLPIPYILISSVREIDQSLFYTMVLIQC